MLEILAVLAVFLGVGGLTVGIIAASSAAPSKQRLQRLARELGDLRRGLGLVPGVPATLVIQARSVPADARALASGSHPGIETALRTAEVARNASAETLAVAGAVPEGVSAETL